MFHDGCAILQRCCAMFHDSCAITRKSRAVRRKDCEVRLFHHFVERRCQA
jgi:hypothetical protein